MADDLEALDPDLLRWADELGRPFLGVDLTSPLGPAVEALTAAKWARDAQARGLLVVEEPEAGEERFALTDAGRARIA